VFLKFKIILYFFKEGRNTYTVNFEQREAYIGEKQVISRTLLRQKRYEHALEVINDGLELCENGAYEEDQRRLRNQQQANLKNKSLCLWKMKNWRKMEETCREYMDSKQGKIKKKEDAKETKIGPNAQTINIGKTPGPDSK
jgi:hypothetical protein